MSSALDLLLALPGIGGNGGIRISSFSQLVGSELLVNNSFDTWSGGLPTGWTVELGTGAPAVTLTEVASGGGAGTGAARFFNDGTGTDSRPRIFQSIMTAGQWYEVQGVVSAATGTLRFAMPLSHRIEVVGTGWGMGRASAAQASYNPDTKPITYIVDEVSVKLMTLNPEVTAYTDGTFDFYFTLPPAAAELRCGFWYRASGDLNYWHAYLYRNRANTDWLARLDSVSSGTATNRISVTGVGTPNALRVVVTGDDHSLYTSADAGVSWTQRGTTITNSTHNTQAGVRAVYNSPITPILMQIRR